MDPNGGDQHAVGVAYRNLVRDVVPGDVVLLDDGLIVLEVEHVKGTQIACRVRQGGKLSDHKGLNKQGGGLSAPALTDKDRRDIQSAARFGLDFMSVSFARNAEDIEEARSLLRAAGGQAHLVAKIERAEAVQHIRSIIDASDVIMVARGDLAVEVGYASMTGLQKGLIRLARARNKVVITATQMLESMIHSPSPTRAEVSDVANAVMDGTDAVMLSAETAVGHFPVRAVRTMAELCIGAEKHETFRRAANYRLEDVFTHVDEAIAMAVMYVANHLNVRAIIALTEVGLHAALDVARAHRYPRVCVHASRGDEPAREHVPWRLRRAVRHRGHGSAHARQGVRDTAARRRGRGRRSRLVHEGRSARRVREDQYDADPHCAGRGSARRAECLRRRAKRSSCPAPVPAAHTKSVFSRRLRRCCRRMRRIRSR
jgi:pyruvate kinase